MPGIFFKIILACRNPFFENGAYAPRFRCVFPAIQGVATCSDVYAPRAYDQITRDNKPSFHHKLIHCHVDDDQYLKALL